MIVLHAIWDHSVTGTLHLWAESSDLSVITARRAKRRTEEERARLHPFVLPPAVLEEVVDDLVGGLFTKDAQAGMLALRLPSVGSGPLPSPELLLDEKPGDSQGAELEWWNVATLQLDASHALDFLLRLPNQSPHGVAFSGSLHFWSEAAKFAFELITRQCFIPSLHEGQRGNTVTCRATWEAVLSPEDLERLRLLAKAMPPICWAFMLPGEKKASLLQDVLLHFINQFIDAFVRESLTSTSFPRGVKGTNRHALPERWLRALASPDPELTVSSAELTDFSVTLRTWLDQIRLVPGDSPFRTCFKLDPPAEDQEDAAAWKISFHLQASDDPSLLIPAEQVWQERSSTLTFLKRKFENPQERLLADLGNAARLFPTIEKSLESSHPRSLPLSTEQAYMFLRETAPLLEDSGFGVLVPPWWQKSAARLGAKLKVTPKSTDSSGLLGLSNLVNYSWSIAVGDTTLTAEEFSQLVALKQPLVQVRGQWVELRPEQIEAAIAFFEKKRKKQNMSLGEALRVGMAQEQSELGLPVIGMEADGWIKDILDRLYQRVQLTPIEVPATFQGQLRPYQLRGVSWLAFLRQFGFGSCLADDMGLGKCISGETNLFVNGIVKRAKIIWDYYGGESIFDGEGYWANPTQQLLTNSIDEATGKIVQTSIKRLYRQHVSTHLRTVHLEDGNSVTITYPHKLLTSKGWTNDLQVGDYVCVPVKLVWEGKPEDPDIIKFLAWQISEGYEPQGYSRVSITQKDPSILKELLDCLHRLHQIFGFRINKPPLSYNDRDETYNLILTSAEYRRFLEAKGYEWGNQSSKKRIPDFVVQADLDSVRIFLRNYFEAEASVVKSMSSIEISTASPKLMQQLSYMLRRFGIWMRISTKQKCATNGSGIYRPYQIGVIGGNALRKFLKEIGFVGEMKQKKLKELCEVVCNTNVEGIPASDLMAEVVAMTQLPIRHFGMPTVYVTGTQQFSPASLQRVITAFDDILSGEAERIYREKPPSRWTAQTLAAYAALDTQILSMTRVKLQCLLEQEVYYCRIKEIEDIEYDGWVYDFEVEEHHNFVANNILCHNTIQMITLLLHERENKNKAPQQQLNPTLLICPMSIVGNWQREVQRFAPSLSVMIHHGAERLSGPAFREEAQRHDIVITTYSLVLRDKGHLAEIEWENVVIDEAQNIKNETAKQTQAIKSLDARHKIALTGTPVENRLSELWSIMEFLNPGYLGSGTEFRKSFALPIERYRDAEQAAVLKQLVQPFVLRRLKTDKEIIQDLPDKLEMKVFCNLTQEQASLYEAVVKEMLEKIEEEAEDMARRGLILSALMRLKQICNHPAQFMSDGSSLQRRSGKLARLEEMLEEVLAEGDKALIFTQFAEMGTLLRQYLQETLGVETLFLHGGTPKKQRDILVQRFQEERRGAPLFILSLKAGGVGLNLTAANHVFHFDRWWNPAVENQATDRAFRIGQKKNVQVHKFVCAGTLEERIDQMIEQKKDLAERIVGAGENWLTEMSTDQLKELFALSREAVGE